MTNQIKNKVNYVSYNILCKSYTPQNLYKISVSLDWKQAHFLWDLKKSKWIKNEKFSLH